MTMLLMSVDAREKEMRWASAGHDVPIVYDREKERFIELKGNDISLGVTQDVYYREHQFTDVQPGQVYLAATDGLWETFNQNGEMFGKKRVRSLLRRLADLTATEISSNISEELSRFRGSSSLDDDISFVVIKVL
jgi:sigma-B regulation protein RsbU (phosphoserine phosphatase)